MTSIEFSVDTRGIARLVLNRPEVRNAFDRETMESISEAFHSLSSEVRVVVISGAGKVFCAGGDLDMMKRAGEMTAQENIEAASRMRKMFDVINSCAVPTIARVHGACMAGGLGVISCCDVVVAASTTKFSFTEVRLGLVPATISPYVLRKCGYAFARASFLTGERFTAPRAYEVGLVHAVCSDEELDGVVDGYVDMILLGAPKALRSARLLIEKVAATTIEDAATFTPQALAEARASGEAAEGIAAFFEKRKPSWFREV